MPVNKNLLFLTMFSLLSFLFSPSPLQAQEIRKTVILPFEVHSKDNAESIGNTFHRNLAEQLRKIKTIDLVEGDRFARVTEGKPPDEGLIRALGEETGAAFAITGSITEFGEVISVDVRIFDFKKGAFLPVIFAQGRGMDGLNDLSVRLTEDVIIRMGAEERIARIEYRGNRRIESSAISQVLKSVSGGVFSEANLAQDIKSIYKMGYFSDVTAEASDLPEGKVITFVVQEKGIVTSIKIEGNKAVSKDDIEAALTVRTRQPLNQEKVKADIERIKELYNTKGYYNAEISYAVENEGASDVRIVFTVVENQRLFIRSITFAGNEAYRAEELRKLMDTKEKGFFSFFTDSGILKKEQLNQDVEKISAYYLNHGFIYAQVGEPEITHDKVGIKINIPITEGKQYMVGKVDIAGDEIKTPRTELASKLQIGKKRYYDREAVIKDMDFLQQACSDEGYAYADIVPRTVPQDKDQTVDVTYVITKGNLVYFNRINITGNNKTRDKVIRRQLSIVEGDLYNKSNLKKSYMALSRLRYFEEVDFQSEKGPEENLTDVNIRVREKPTGMFSIGAGYSALDSAIFTAQVAQQNLFGRGQILSLRGSLSARSSTYELSFTEPWLFDIPLWSKFDIWKTDREYDTYDLDTKGTGVTLGYPIWESVSGYLGYKFSMDNVRNIKDDASTYIKKQEGETTTSSLTGTLTRDTTDDYIFPSSGSKTSFSVEYTGGFLQGDAQFIKYNLTSAKFFPLPLDTVFGIRGRGGFLQETGGKDAPVYERFYLGGMNSLRGLRSVGPKDPLTGDVIGGLTMLNVNAEIVFPLIKNAGMKGLIFFDTGNAWERGYHISDMRKTAGLGVRWYSPVGPLRLEWGYVLDRKDQESASRWEFTIGTFM